MLLTRQDFDSQPSIEAILIASLRRVDRFETQTEQDCYNVDGGKSQHLSCHHKILRGAFNYVGSTLLFLELAEPIAPTSQFMFNTEISFGDKRYKLSSMIEYNGRDHFRCVVFNARSEFFVYDDLRNQGKLQRAQLSYLGAPDGWRNSFFLFVELI